MNVWTFSEEKAGTLTQCVSVARRLDPAPVVRTIERLARWRRGPLSPYFKSEQAEPDVIVSCGRLAERHVRLVKRKYGGRPLAVHLQPPSAEAADVYDLAFVSRHDRDCDRHPATVYAEMIGVPHAITKDTLDDLRPQARDRFLRHSSARAVTLLIGGSNRAYRFNGETIERLVATVRSLAADGSVVLVSTSRRTEPEVLNKLLAIRDDRVVVWNREGDNPYRQFLAAADAFIVTKDTVTMHCEALASGRPVFSFDLAGSEGSQLRKFEWFHRDLSETLKLTRPFDPSLPGYDYRFDDQSALVADFIRAQMRKAG